MDWQDLASPARLEDMRAAIELVQQWQEVSYRTPILENPEGFFQEKERIATLLVDHHLGKLARKVRLLGSGDEGLDSGRFLDEWVEIVFFTTLWQRFDSLPDGLKLNLIYQSGPNITKRHLAVEPGFMDQFIVVGVEQEMEERLIRRSVYVYGLKSKRYFLILDFSFNRQPFDQNYAAGEIYQGEVVAYPFPGSLRIAARAMQREQGYPGIYDTIPVPGIEQTVSDFHAALKINPFCTPFPAVVELQSDQMAGEWIITNPQGREIRLADMDGRVADVFYAVCFRKPTRFAVLISREGIRPISYFNGEVFLGFDAFQK